MLNKFEKTSAPSYVQTCALVVRRLERRSLTFEIVVVTIDSSDTITAEARGLVGIRGDTQH